MFVEKGVFTPEQGRQVLESGRALGLIPRMHADEFGHTGGAELAAELGAASADHLMFASDAGIRAMAEADVTPILLPGTTLFLGMRDWAPARKMIEAGCRVALASDFNPGLLRLPGSPADPAAGLPAAAHDLRGGPHRHDPPPGPEPEARPDLGHLHPGALGKVLLWEVQHPLELVYWLGEAFVPEVVG